MKYEIEQGWINGDVIPEPLLCSTPDRNSSESLSLVDKIRTQEKRSGGDSTEERRDLVAV